MHSSPSNAGEAETSLSGTEMLWYSLACIVCVVGAGFFVGLQVGLFSIDRLFLRVLTTTGTPKERKQAESLLGVLKLHHWTLVALVLMNAAFVMTLPILLETMFNEVTALIVSITAVLFVGEVVPLAVFVRWAIPVCAYFVKWMWLAIIVTAPVSYPMGKVLDRVLGHSELLLDREDLAALIVGPHAVDEDENEETAASPDRPSGHGPNQPSLSPTSAAGASTGPTAPPLDAASSTPREGDSTTAAAAADSADNASYQLRESEVKMLQAAMLLSTDTVKEHLNTTAAQAFMLSSRDVLDRATILRILQAGFSRVPVYFGEDKRHIIGALIVNSLVSLCFTSPDPPPLVSNYPLREVMRLSEEASLYDAYLAFRTGPSNMAAIYDSAGVTVGLLTLSDVLATLYNAAPVAPVALKEQYVRRQQKMMELVEGMKLLQATKLSSPAGARGLARFSGGAEGTIHSQTPTTPQQATEANRLRASLASLVTMSRQSTTVASPTSAASPFASSSPLAVVTVGRSQPASPASLPPPRTGKGESK